MQICVRYLKVDDVEALMLDAVQFKVPSCCDVGVEVGPRQSEECGFFIINQQIILCTSNQNTHLPPYAIVINRADVVLA